MPISEKMPVENFCENYKRFYLLSSQTIHAIFIFLYCDQQLHQKHQSLHVNEFLAKLPTYFVDNNTTSPYVIVAFLFSKNFGQQLFSSSPFNLIPVGVCLLKLLILFQLDHLFLLPLPLLPLLLPLLLNFPSHLVVVVVVVVVFLLSNILTVRQPRGSHPYFLIISTFH
jgi:hypothetical protein